MVCDGQVYRKRLTFDKIVLCPKECKSLAVLVAFASGYDSKVCMCVTSIKLTHGLPQYLYLLLTQIHRCVLDMAASQGRNINNATKLRGVSKNHSPVWLQSPVSNPIQSNPILANTTSSPTPNTDTANQPHSCKNVSQSLQIQSDCVPLAV